MQLLLLILYTYLIISCSYLDEIIKIYSNLTLTDSDPQILEEVGDVFVRKSLKLKFKVLKLNFRVLKAIASIWLRQIALRLLSYSCCWQADKNV
ncbi:hypothetical protein [Nostoc sp.]|uniref:hypothetical protein n=1 Tax=Nostoc sp. TaxID=1180 RepID=UPI002FFADA88